MATGLNFQTQTIINSNLDPDSNNSVLFENQDTKIDGVNKKVLRIKRDFVFVKDNVVSIRKRKGYNPSMCKATIDFSNSTLLAALKAGGAKTYARLDIYVGIEGAEPYIYSTPWTQKGMPFWLEFTVKSGDGADVIAKNVANIIKKNHLFLCDHDLIKVTVSGNTLVLEGATEYQRFKSISISTFGTDAEFADKVAEIDPKTTEVASSATGIVIDERGKNGFGTYSQIVKDLRLPTAANYQWTHIRQVETPIVGAIYDEYIIDYAAPATNDSLQAVGHRMTTNTQHVFWVKNDTNLIKAWEDAWKAVVGDVIADADASSSSHSGSSSNQSSSGGSSNPSGNLVDGGGSSPDIE